MRVGMESIRTGHIQLNDAYIRRSAPCAFDAYIRHSATKVFNISYKNFVEVTKLSSKESVTLAILVKQNTGVRENPKH